MGDALTAIGGELTTINNGGGIKYFHSNSTLTDSNAGGANSIAVGPAAVASAQNSVAMGDGATASGAGDVALGSGSIANGAVATTSMTIRGTTYNVAGTAPVGTVSVGSDGAERTITNVAAGRVDVNSTDAINGSQLYATNQAVEALGTGIGDLDEFAVQSDRNPDDTKANSVTLQGGDPNAPVLVSNVATGVATPMQ